MKGLNELLMGPAGSGSLLHVDFPMLESYWLVIQGKKRVCWWRGNPERIPDYIQTHAIGREMYSRTEYMQLERWAEANGGGSVVLSPGESGKLNGKAPYVAINKRCVHLQGT